jgi:hypothetical protein
MSWVKRIISKIYGYLLKQDGGYLLLQNGGKIILGSQSAWKNRDKSNKPSSWFNRSSNGSSNWENRAL